MAIENDETPGAPTAVRLEPDAVYIEWRDGHQSFYPHRFLRSECPCAQCVEEMTGRRLIFIENIEPDVLAVDWMQVGRYAISFLFTDAHDTGIYPFTLLRKICQCVEHRTARQRS